MNLSIHRAELQKRLTELQGQKANLEAGLEQVTVAVERTIGSLQMLDVLEQGNSVDQPQEVPGDAL